MRAFYKVQFLVEDHVVGTIAWETCRGGDEIFEKMLLPSPTLITFCMDKIMNLAYFMHIQEEITKYSEMNVDNQLGSGFDEIVITVVENSRF